MYSKFQPRPGAHERSAFTQPRNPQFKGGRPNQQEAPPNLASALKVKNFRKLLEVAGEENLGVALDLTMHRVKELAEGVNFSDEMTHHIETTLELSSGFLDQVNPVLTTQDIERLKSAQPVRDPYQDLPPEPPVAKSTLKTPTQKVSVTAAEPASSSVPLAQAQSPETATPLGDASFTASVPVHASTPQPAQPSPSVQQPVLEEKIMGRSSKKSETQQAAPAQAAPVAQVVSNEEDALRETRRLNLLTLTAQPGAKSQLARLTNLSAANISHRLHGNKIFDKETADFFCKQLALPEGWFETPKAPEDVPVQTVQLLGDKGGSSAPAAPKARGPRKSKTSAATPAKVTTPAAKGTKAPAGAVSLSLSSAALGKTAEAAAAAPQAPAPVASAPAAAPAAPAVARPAAPAAKAAPAAQAAPSPAPVAAPAPAAAPSARLASQALAGEEREVGPIAEALVRTLASKSRGGALSEARALELLVEIAAL